MAQMELRGGDPRGILGLHKVEEDNVLTSRANYMVSQLTQQVGRLQSLPGIRQRA